MIVNNFIEQEEIIDNHFLLNVDVDKLFNSELKADINSRKIKGMVLRTQGYVGNRPSDFKGEYHEDDTWAIDCLFEEGDVFRGYLYVSQYEYEQDVARIFSE